MIAVKARGIDAVRRALKKVGAVEMKDVLEVATDEIVDKTKTRIEETKQTPNGKSWPAWSKPYAKTRKGGHSLLEASGDLLRSITRDVDPNKAEVGSPLRYARRLALGDKGRGGIRARQFLGLTDREAAEVKDSIAKWVARNAL